MNCPVCGYALSPLDAVCPRCRSKGRKIQNPYLVPQWLSAPAPHADGSARRLGFLSLSAVALLGIWWLIRENPSGSAIPTFAPALPTVVQPTPVPSPTPPPIVTTATVFQLKRGSSYAQVEALIGQEGTKTSEAVWEASTGTLYTTYKWTNPDGSFLIVDFIGDQMNLSYANNLH